MSTHSWLLVITLATLAIVIFIAIRKSNESGVSEVRKDIEGLRQQWDVEHKALQSDIKVSKGWLLRILNRFGFLQDKE